jgi:hypothetical protein
MMLPFQGHLPLPATPSQERLHNNAENCLREGELESATEFPQTCHLELVTG